MYYYALFNPITNIIDTVCVGVEAARKHLMESQEQLIVRPIMLETEYALQSIDYTGTLEGKPYLVYQDLDGSTVYGPVVLVKNWSYWSHLKHLAPKVEKLELPEISKSLMMCVETRSDTIRMSVCAPKYGLLIRFPAMTKMEIVRHWMKDSFSQDNEKYGLLFDTAVLRLIPDYLSSNELHQLRNEFIASLKQI